MTQISLPIKFTGRHGKEISESSSNEDLLEFLFDVKTGRFDSSEDERAQLRSWLIDRAKLMPQGEGQVVTTIGKPMAGIGRDDEGEPFVWLDGERWPLDFDSLPIYVRIRLIEENRYKKNKELLGASVGLIQDLSDLYEEFMSLVGRANLQLVDLQPFSFANCLQACRYQLVMGSLTILRGHITDAAFYARKAIEFFAFAVKIKRDPGASDAWLKIAEGKDRTKEQERYRKQFPIMSTLAKADKLAGDLEPRYDWLSNSTHPSFEGIGKQCEIEERNHNFEYFDPIEDGESGFLEMMFQNTIITHRTILIGLNNLIKEEESTFDHDEWEKVSAPVFEKIHTALVALEPKVKEFLSDDEADRSVEE